MSVNPVAAIASGQEAQWTAEGVRPPQNSARESIPPGSELDPKPEAIALSKTSAAAELPEDEVEVQRDNQSGGEIVVRYMDHAGNLILQVPSQQLLGIARGIDQDLEREQKVRAAAEATQEGSKANGH